MVRRMEGEQTVRRTAVRRTAVWRTAVRQTVQQTAMAAIHQSCTPCFRNRLRYSVGGMPISWVKTLE